MTAQEVPVETRQHVSADVAPVLYEDTYDE
jgi:hypothetical protein